MDTTTETPFPRRSSRLKAKVVAASPSSSSSSSSSSSPPTSSHHHYHHGDDETSPPLSPPISKTSQSQLRVLYLHHLPDPAHEVIASFLTTYDLQQLMECSLWLFDTYRIRVQDLILSDSKPINRHELRILLRRHPGLIRIITKGSGALAVCMEAMRLKHLNKIESLEMREHHEEAKDTQSALQCLFRLLSKGLCPKIHSIRLIFHPDIAESMMVSLGDALRSRKAKGCCGLRSLEIRREWKHLAPKPDLSSVLSSGSCDTLKELKLGRCELHNRAYEALAGWLVRTKAVHLRVLAIEGANHKLAMALSCEGVAPHLQSLRLPNNEESLGQVFVAIERGAWPDLRDMRIDPDRSETPRLMEAIRVGARELRVLKVGRGIGAEGCASIARGLSQGACPRLEELDLEKVYIRDDGLIELMRALGGGAPCNATLRRLNLYDCRLTPVGMKEMSTALVAGIVPKLEFLNLSYNEDIEDDGVMSLADAMKKGALLQLREIKLMRVRVSNVGVKALFQAFGKDACPKLQRAKLCYNRVYFKEQMGNMIKAMNRRRKVGEIEVE